MNECEPSQINSSNDNDTHMSLYKLQSILSHYLPHRYDLNSRHPAMFQDTVHPLGNR